MSVIGNPLLLTPEGYQISRSVRLRSSASAYFNRTPASAGNRQKFTISAWVKRGKLATSSPIMGAGASGSTEDRFMFAGNDTFLFDGYSSGSTVFYMNTTAVYRDPSAWYHFVCEVDTTQATSSNRIKLYVNGVQVTAFATATYPSQNANLNFNNNVAQYIGYTPDPYYADQYFTEINFIDGQALTPSSFGETDAVTGVWKPKKYAGTYGTNGFYLNFSDPSAATAAAIGKDYSGNGNNWTPNNISVTAGATYDSMIDTPTPYADGGNGRGNYAVLASNAPGIGTISAANLQNTSGTTTIYSAISSMSVDSGKWYWEVTVSAINSGNQYPFIGAYRGIPNSLTGAVRPGGDVNGFSYRQNGVAFVDATTFSSSWGAMANNDVIGVALDLTNLQVSFYKNNTLQGTITGLVAGTYTPADSEYNGSNVAYNFGQRPFAYTPPTGFKALNTQNLPEPTIKKGGEYFNAVLYTGNGTGQTVSGVGFQPDFVWGKSRSNIRNHNLYDAVRGSGNMLLTNGTNAELTGGELSAFTSDGFTLGSNVYQMNASGDSMVAWNWKESATAGFDIVTYTGNGTNPGRTVAHNLGVTPAMIITKSRSGTGEWPSYHKSLPISNTLYLNATYASTTYLNRFSAVSSTDFTTGSNGVELNANGVTYVAYLFAEVPGFSKFGSYTGNGSADGPFVFCGFRPRWVMFKRTNTTEQWAIYDTARDSFNTAELELFADSSSAEYDGNRFVDVLSNGFKLRSSSAANNASGSTYIFAAFAEHPFKNALAR